MKAPLVLIYTVLIGFFLSAWQISLSPQYYSFLLTTILLEFVLIQFASFYLLYARFHEQPRERLNRSVIALSGVALFAAGISYFNNIYILGICVLLFGVRVAAANIEGDRGTLRLHALFRWLFDTGLFILTAIVFLILPVPSLSIQIELHELGYVTAGPWVDYPQLAAAQGVAYFLFQLILHCKAASIVAWLESLSSR